MGEENTPPFWMDSQNSFSNTDTPKHIHLLGTDNLGRDSLARLMKGTQISLLIGITGSFIIMIIGVIYGAIAGYLGNKVGFIMMRIVDIIYSVPSILVALLLGATLKPRISQFVNINPSSPFSKFVNSLGAPLISIFITIALIYWVGMSRIVRGQVLTLKKREFVLAAKMLGVKPQAIIKKHILPNCISQIIVAACLEIPSTIFLESFLSFLGVGVSAPLTSLGSLTSDALNVIYTKPYCLIYPTIVLSLLVLSLNLFGDGLRDAFDPKIK
jgi:oligopeptide transport system permease protein